MKRFCLLIILFAFIFISPVRGEHIDQKDRISYLDSVNSEQYLKKFNNVVKHAKSYADKHYISGAAIVSDIDETLLDNKEYYKIYKNYTKDNWYEWIDQAKAVPFESTLDFLKWAKTRGYKVFFITGRTVAHKNATIENLKKYNVEYDGIIFKPENYDKPSTGFFKTSTRKKLNDEGYKIIISIGDQKSDMQGGFGKGFKLPNPFYKVP